MNKKPFFSVIMASYNSEKYIEKSIQSVINQTFSDWELIISDDASQDNTRHIILKSSLLDKRIRFLFLNKNRGPGAARNTAISIAKGYWISILDSDDLYLPNKLSEQYRIISNESDLILLGSACFHIDEFDKRVGKHKYPKNSSQLKRNLVVMKRFPPHSSIVYRSDVVKICRGFNENYRKSQDYDFWLRLTSQGEFQSCQIPLVEYRVHSRSISFEFSDQGFSQFVYGTAALVCYKLRQMGYPDPSTNDGKLWCEFIEYVKEFVSIDINKEYLDWKKDVIKRLKRSDRLLDLSMNIVKILAHSPVSHVINFVIEKFFGSSLPEKCFRSWISRLSNTI
jgi:teichuronic acid biosynthesis glycosyltransferase TuaG